MTSDKAVLGIVGSPNRDGRTFELVSAALQGAAETGAPVELVQMADHVVDACRDCLPWVCLKNLKCSFEDEAFEFLTDRVMNCGALVLGTPVYWWDTSGMIKYFILKMFRVFARSAPLHGLPAFGPAIAGGTGNGLVSGLRPVYHFFQMMQMRALDPLPATRFDFADALRRSADTGAQLAAMRLQRHPFAGLEERLLWYDRLPYLGMSRADERRLLAALTALAHPDQGDAATLAGMARADALHAAGRELEAQLEVSRVYQEAVGVFDKK